MTEELKQLLARHTVNSTETLERFLNDEQLYIHFLYKFTQDSTFAKFLDAVDADDYIGSFEQAHALKGVCGNLGFQDFYQYFAELSDDLRSAGKPIDFVLFQERVEAVRKSYPLLISELLATEDVLGAKNK